LHAMTTDTVAPPAPQPRCAVVHRDGARMHLAETELRDVGEPRHLDGRQRVRGRAIAELAALSVTPAPQRRIGLATARRELARADRARSAGQVRAAGVATAARQVLIAALAGPARAREIGAAHGARTTGLVRVAARVRPTEAGIAEAGAGAWRVALAAGALGIR